MPTCPHPGRFDTGRERVPIRPSHGRTPGGASSWAYDGAVASVYLSPADEDRLRVFAAAELARRTLARGLLGQNTEMCTWSKWFAVMLPRSAIGTHPADAFRMSQIRCR
jgi:hypothetical protein